MNMKKILSFAALILSASIMLTGCGGTNADKMLTDAEATDNAADPDLQVTAAAEEEAEILNFIPPQSGEKIAVITVRDFGEIKIKLFPEAAGKGVENFVGLADMNYYDELIFHRIIPDFMNQGGDPRGNGTGGSCLWGEKFDGGIPEGLYHFTGAVAYANSGSTSTNGSQFYIVNTQDGDYGSFDLRGYPENVKAMYEEKGGTPFLDGGYTVFGQVFEGIDVVRAMSQVETDENDKPLSQVVMESVRIVEYEE